MTLELLPELERQIEAAARAPSRQAGSSLTDADSVAALAVLCADPEWNARLVGVLIRCNELLAKRDIGRISAPDEQKTPTLNEGAERGF